MVAEQIVKRLAISLCLMMACFNLIACGAATPTASDKTIDATIGGHDFTLQLALTNEQRYQGLSDVPEIAADGGMLFVFPGAARREFVMRRCLVPIDIIFLGPNGRIVNMHAMQVEPYDTPDYQLKRYPSRWPAQFAIELKGGTLATMNLQLGQFLNLPWRELEKLTE